MALISPIAMGSGITRQVIYNLILCMTGRSVDGTATDTMHITHWVAELTKLRLCLSGINDAQFVIYHLCMHPEHTDKLRDEAAAFDDANFNAKNEDMAYLGSFIKETLRSSPGRL
jgi:hypothetical protein